MCKTNDDCIHLKCSPGSSEWSSGEPISSCTCFSTTLGCIMSFQIKMELDGFYYLKLFFDVLFPDKCNQLRLTIWAQTEDGRRLFCFVRERSFHDLVCLLVHESDQLIQNAAVVFCRVERIKPNNFQARATDPSSQELDKNIFLTAQLEAYEQEYMADCEIVAGKQVFRVSKIVLGTQSGYFRAAFRHSTTKECQTSRFIIEDFNPILIEKALRYMYTGQVENLGNYDISLLVVADYLLIESLRDLCIKSIHQTMCVERLPALFEVLRPGRGGETFEELDELFGQFLHKTVQHFAKPWRRSHGKATKEHRRKLRRCFEAFQWTEDFNPSN